MDGVCVCVSLQVQSECSESWFKACYVHPSTMIEAAYWPPTVTCGLWVLQQLTRRFLAEQSVWKT